MPENGVKKTRNKKGGKITEGWIEIIQPFFYPRAKLAEDKSVRDYASLRLTLFSGIDRLKNQRGSCLKS
jgi:hypothetical protein